MSGTNAHVVVESYRRPPGDAARQRAPCYLLAVSAKTEAALRTRIDDLIGVLGPCRGTSATHAAATACAAAAAGRLTAFNLLVDGNRFVVLRNSPSHFVSPLHAL